MPALPRNRIYGSWGSNSIRIITLLRKERGITQKQAAQDLGIQSGTALPL